jgi:glucans biosynthesis protein C
LSFLIVTTTRASPDTDRVRTRLGFIDNLRWVLIVLVVVFHAAVTYGPIGSWFYLTRQITGDMVVASDFGNLLLSLFVVLLQAFFMGLFFMVSGYFVPGSVERKGTRKFVWDRVVRLGVPSLLFILALKPLITLMINPRQLGTLASFTSYLTGYATNVAGWDTGPMWFAVALLFFSALAALSLRRWRWDQRRVTLSRGRLVVFILLIATVSFLVRLVYPIGTAVWNMQLAFFTQYVAFFLFGVFAYGNGWLSSISYSDGRFWLRVAVVSIFLLLIPALLLGGAVGGNLVAFSGGLTWQSAVTGIWEQMFAVGISLGLLTWFRERHDHQSRVELRLTDDSFAVYVFFPPVLVGIALLMAPYAFPSLLKFLILGVLGTLCSFGLAEFVLRRIPGLRRILFQTRTVRR